MSGGSASLRHAWRVDATVARGFREAVGELSVLVDTTAALGTRLFSQ
jgi:hypothetical protein